MPVTGDARTHGIVREVQGNPERALNFKSKLFGMPPFWVVLARQSDWGEVQEVTA